MRVTLVIESETPLALRANRGQDSADTLDYLPGSTLRGGLAAAHALMRPQSRDEFREFFLSENVLFNNGYPCDAETAGLASYASLPAPQTAMTCKRCPGFLSDTPRDPRQKTHGVRDTIIAAALLAQSPTFSGPMAESVNRCGHVNTGGVECQEPLDHFGGFFGGSGATSYSRRSQPKEVRTRTGISRARGGVHQGILYSREMLSRSGGFQAELEVDEGCEAALRAFVEEAASSGMLRLGNNRTRGLGGVAVRHWRREEAPSEVDIDDRCRRFGAALNEVAASSGVELRHDHYLPVLAVSDVVLKDGLGRHRGRLDSDWLRAEADIDGASLIHSSAGMRRVSGWNAFLGLPRADEWAISMGSVFLLGLPEAPGDETYRMLSELERRGTGERRAEGFGRVRFADPFHLEVRAV